MLMPYSQYRQYIPWWEVFLGSWTASRSPHLVRVVHTTGRQLLIGHGFLAINNSWMTVLKTWVTVKQPQLTFGSRRMNKWRNNQYQNSPCVFVWYRRWPNHNLMYTVDHTFGYRSKKFVLASTELSCWTYRNGPFHRPRPLPGLRYFSCLHVRPCLTNKWRKWREIKRKHWVFQDIR